MKENRMENVDVKKKVRARKGSKTTATAEEITEIKHKPIPKPKKQEKAESVEPVKAEETVLNFDNKRGVLLLLDDKTNGIDIKYINKMSETDLVVLSEYLNGVRKSVASSFNGNFEQNVLTSLQTIMGALRKLLEK
jgi:hypothetical protein